MALATALVTVEVTSLEGLSAADPGIGNTRYARATIKGGSGPVLKTGRTRPIPNAGGSFDITAEASPWKFQTMIDAGTDIEIRVQICKDLGSSPPPATIVYILAVPDPWSPGTFTLGAGLQAKVTITRDLVNPTDKAFLARAGIKTAKGGALVVPQGYYLDFEEIDGLYQPDPAAAIPDPGSKKVPGYISADNLGRIFTNRKPDGSWANDTQFIDVSVKLTAFGGAKIPSAAKIHWTIEDVDDPTNDEPDFHRDWGPWVDKNDYDAANNPIGAHSSDNAGAFSDGNLNINELFGAGVADKARWAQAAAGPAPSAISLIEATTPVSLSDPRHGKSSVRIHCTNVLGTNLVIRLGVDGLPAGSRLFPAKSGVMTMWNRIQVQVVRMASAHSLSGALPEVSKYFFPACVQMDFEAEVVAGPDTPVIAPKGKREDVEALNWTDSPGVFTRKNQGGWFFLGAARLGTESSPPGPGSPPLYDDTNYSLGLETDAGGVYPFVKVPVDLSNPAFVEFTWTDGSGNELGAVFDVRSKKVKGGLLDKSTKLFLAPMEATPEFTGHDADGSLEHAFRRTFLYFPQHQLLPGMALVSGGLNVPSAGARVTVLGAESMEPLGISPTPQNPWTGNEHFAGRTVIYTHAPSYSIGIPPMPRSDFNRRIIRVVVHEFIHAFGLPHMCGLWNWRTPRQGGDARSCCMNYNINWLVDPSSKNLMPGTNNHQGNDMCARHLMEIRRVHLHKNSVLGW